MTHLVWTQKSFIWIPDLDSVVPWLPSRKQKIQMNIMQPIHLVTRWTWILVKELGTAKRQDNAWTLIPVHFKVLTERVRARVPVVMLSLSSSAGRTSVCLCRLGVTSCTPKLSTGWVSRNSDTAVKLARPFSWSWWSSITYSTWWRGGMHAVAWWKHPR